MTQAQHSQTPQKPAEIAMAPRKPKPPAPISAPAESVDPAECAGAKELTSTLSALLQLDLRNADEVSDLCLPQLLQLAELIRQASLLGLWETSKKRLPLALSSICDWALLQAATPFDIVDGAATVFCLCLVTEQQCPKDETAAHQALVKELLRLDIPSKLFRAALAAHERACERPCLAHDMGPPPAATPASGPTGTSASGDDDSKAWAFQLASSVATHTQRCISPKLPLGLEVLKQLSVQSRYAGASLPVVLRFHLTTVFVLRNFKVSFNHPQPPQELSLRAMRGTTLQAGTSNVWTRRAWGGLECAGQPADQHGCPIYRGALR